MLKFIFSIGCKLLESAYKALFACFLELVGYAYTNTRHLKGVKVGSHFLMRDTKGV